MRSKSNDVSKGTDKATSDQRTTWAPVHALCPCGSSIISPPRTATTPQNIIRRIRSILFTNQDIAVAVGGAFKGSCFMRRQAARSCCWNRKLPVRNSIQAFVKKKTSVAARLNDHWLLSSTHKTKVPYWGGRWSMTLTLAKPPLFERNLEMSHTDCAPPPQAP